MPRNNLDLAMLITDEILNEFERKGVVHIPLDKHKYSFPLQDRIQIALEIIGTAAGGRDPSVPFQTPSGLPPPRLELHVTASFKRKTTPSATRPDDNASINVEDSPPAASAVTNKENM